MKIPASLVDFTARASAASINVTDNVPLAVPVSQPPFAKQLVPLFTGFSFESDKAKTSHDCIMGSHASSLVVHTDGSAINSKVGASAVIYDTGFVGQTFLGSNTTATVYLAELKGIHMALLMAQTLKRESLVIFSDSQAAIRAVQDPQSNGQQILARIINVLEGLARLQMKVEIRQIPVHQGIPGNEKADKAVKKATGW